MEQLARKNGDSLILLPDNLHPRHSIGYMIGYIFGVIRAAADIEQEKKKAINEAKDEIGGLAMDIAGKVVEKEINEADHKKLIDDFISKVGA